MCSMEWRVVAALGAAGRAMWAAPLDYIHFAARRRGEEERVTNMAPDEYRDVSIRCQTSVFACG